MAAAAYRYNDSSAYAIPAPETFPARAPARERESERVRKVTAAPVFAISPFSIRGFTFFLVLIMLTVLANVSLTEISRETSRQESRLAELTAAEKKLMVEYETTFDLDEIEVYATSVLGMTYTDMQYNGTVQTFMYDLAVIPDTVSAKKGGATEFIGFIRSLLEYIKQ
jgi:hypothetical protein